MAKNPAANKIERSIASEFHRTYLHQRKCMSTKSNFYLRVATAFFLLSVCWWLPITIRAATQARVSISAIVVTTCNITVNLVNGIPSVQNSCNGLAKGSADGSATVSRDSESKTVTIVY